MIKKNDKEIRNIQGADDAQEFGGDCNEEREEVLKPSKSKDVGDLVGGGTVWAWALASPGQTCAASWL
jgi:hypothetical protein